MAEYDLQNNPVLSISEARVASTGQLTSLRLQDLCIHTQADQKYQQLQHYILNGFPGHYHQLPEQSHRYICSQLALDDGFIVYGCCPLIPSALRPQILQELHTSLLSGLKAL